jgi:hypothetical protein
MEQASSREIVSKPDSGLSDPTGSIVTELESTLNTVPSNTPPTLDSFKTTRTADCSSFHFLHMLNASSIDECILHLRAIALGREAAEAAGAKGLSLNCANPTRRYLSNWHNVQVLNRGVVSKIGSHQRTSPLAGGRRDPGICGLDWLSGAPALIQDCGPDRTRALIRKKRQAQRHVLFESGAAGSPPVVSRRPQQQLGPGHEGNHQLMTRYGFYTPLPQRVISVKEDRNHVGIEKQDVHLASAWVAEP